MTLDFTYDRYDRLLEEVAATGVPFLTVREYLAGEPLPEGFVVLRHDVDRKPGNALDFARIEADRGVASTYYFRAAGGFDRGTIEAVESMGHEVGYHYEDLDTADGDHEAARASFAENLEELRSMAAVDTACMHGNPLTPYDNRDLWGDDVSPESYGLAGEAYLSVDFGDLHYYSDTGRTWRSGDLKVKDHPVGEAVEPEQVDTTVELTELVVANPERRYYVLSHPDRWADDPGEWAVEAAFDTAKNAAKRLLVLAR